MPKIGMAANFEIHNSLFGVRYSKPGTITSKKRLMNNEYPLTNDELRIWCKLDPGFQLLTKVTKVGSD